MVASKQIALDLEFLKERLAFVEAVMQSWGIQGRWVSTKQAAAILSVKPSLLSALITKSEAQRVTNQLSVWEYGVHYRNIAPPESQKPLWQVNFVAAQQYFNTPD